MQDQEELDEIESWRMRLREEPENILPNIRRLPIHRKTLHDARAQNKIVFYHIPLFLI